MPENILELKSVVKSFVRRVRTLRGEDKIERHKILDGLDLFVNKGSVCALIGGNGSGKTTLFNIISGFISADNGEVLFRSNANVIELQKLPAHKITRCGIGRLFQDNHLFLDMTVLENMLIADSNSYSEKSYISLIYAKRIKKLELENTYKAKRIFVDLFGDGNIFWEQRYQPVRTLSYGQQRLLGMARLLMGNYSLVLLDEPTAGVNPAVNEQIGRIIKKMVSEKNMGVFLIEHSMRFVLDNADFCWFMSDGKIAAFGSPIDVIGNPKVRKTYLGA